MLHTEKWEWEIHIFLHEKQPNQAHSPSVTYITRHHIVKRDKWQTEPSGVGEETKTLLLPAQHHGSGVWGPNEIIRSLLLRALLAMTTRRASVSVLRYWISLKLGEADSAFSASYKISHFIPQIPSYSIGWFVCMSAVWCVYCRIKFFHRPVATRRENLFPQALPHGAVVLRFMVAPQEELCVKSVPLWKGLVVV